VFPLLGSDPEKTANSRRDPKPLSQLGPLPETPSGFVVRLHTDGEGYIFSIKDDRDACRYGVFSDQQGTLYEASPTLPLIAS
jgi:hypothetical protein